MADRSDRTRRACGGSVWQNRNTGRCYMIVHNRGGFVMAVAKDDPQSGWVAWESDWRDDMEWVRGTPETKGSK